MVGSAIQATGTAECEDGHKDREPAFRGKIPKRWDTLAPSFWKVLHQTNKQDEVSP